MSRKRIMTELTLLGKEMGQEREREGEGVYENIGGIEKHSSRLYH